MAVFERTEHPPLGRHGLSHLPRSSRRLGNCAWPVGARAGSGGAGGPGAAGGQAGKKAVVRLSDGEHVYVKGLQTIPAGRALLVSTPGGAPFPPAPSPSG